MDLTKLNSLAALAKQSKELAGVKPERKRYLLLPIDSVVSHEQVRKTFDDLEGLADSIKELGIQVPINVHEKDSSGKYVIIQGERRWRAAKLAGLKKIPVIIDEEVIENDKRTLMQLTENIQRDDMRPLEIARAMKSLADTGMSSSEIGRRLGRSHTYVSMYLNLCELPSLLQTLAEEGSIKDATTLQTLKKVYAIRPDDAENLILGTLDENRSMTRASAQALYRKLSKPSDDVSPEVSAKSKGAPQIEEHDTAGNEVRTTVQHPKKSEQKVENSQPPKVVNKGTSNEPAAAGQTGIADDLVDKVQTVSEGIRFEVEVLLDTEGSVSVVAGYLSPNIVAKEEGKICVTLLNGEVLIVPIDEVQLTGVRAVSEV